MTSRRSSLELTRCPEGTVLNPLTNRCVDRTNPVGRLIATVQSIMALGRTLPRSSHRVLNPVSQRYVRVGGATGQLIEAVLKDLNGGACPEGMVVNPGTGVCVSAGGTLGRSLAGQWNCLRYGSRPASFNFIPLDHQVALANYLVSTDYRGILLNWSLGSGKTCAAILALDQLLNTGRYQRVYVFSPGSLRENFLYQYCAICGQDPGRMRRVFDFFSYNYSQVEERLPSPAEMENSIVVVDEAHNLISGYLNESRNYVAVYNLLTQLRRVKIMLLTGTPITRSVDEPYHLLQLINPGHFTNLADYRSHLQTETIYRAQDGSIVTTEYGPVQRITQGQVTTSLRLAGEAVETTEASDDVEIYTIEQAIIPDERLRAILRPVVSRVSQLVNRDQYPTVERNYLYVPMTLEQYLEWNQVYEQERKVSPPEEGLAETDPELYKRQKASYYLAFSMLRSRQRGNMIYPTELQRGLALTSLARRSPKTISTVLLWTTLYPDRPLPEELRIPTRDLDLSGRAAQEELRTELLAELENLVAMVKPDRIVERGGWVDGAFIEALNRYSPKFSWLLNLITQLPGKHVVYSQFKQRYGIWLIGAMLELLDIPYLTFTGDMDDQERERVTGLFNGSDNLQGERYRVLLMTEAGAEGQNFLQVRYLHLMEASINEFKLRQVMGRVIRYGSHTLLPPDQRTITIIRYFAYNLYTVINTGFGYQENRYLTINQLRAKQGFPALPEPPVGLTELPPNEIPSNFQTSDFFAYYRGIGQINQVQGLNDYLDSLPMVPNMTGALIRQPDDLEILTNPPNDPMGLGVTLVDDQLEEDFSRLQL